MNNPFEELMMNKNKLNEAKEMIRAYFGLTTPFHDKTTWADLRHLIATRTDFELNGDMDVDRFIYKEMISKNKDYKTKAINRKKAYRKFHTSEEWRRLRYKVLKKFNGCCCLCGRSHQKHGVVIHVDHIKPRSKYPELKLDENNLQLLCEDCNLGKSNRDSIDWRPIPETKIVLETKGSSIRERIRSKTINKQILKNN